jgi:SseB protein C-terminal domain/SseB protein N-terminal domain
VTVTFRPENPLEDALLAARETDDLALLLRALADADVYLPAPGEGPAEERRVTAAHGDSLSLPLLRIGGRPFVPVFTSLTQLGRFRPEGGGYMKLAGRALPAIWPDGTGLALNPGGDFGLPLGAEQVARLRAAPPAENDAGFLLGEPKEEPASLLTAVGRFCSARPEVRAAYRALLVRRPGARPEPVVGLELAPEADANAVVDAAAEAVRAAGVDRLALLPLGETRDHGPVARFLVEKTAPFWSRRTDATDATDA